MSIETKANLVRKVFEDVDHDIREFCLKTGMRCVENCGHCCMKPDIEASVLEFFPLAYHLYREGKAEIWLEKIKDEEEKPLCALFSSQLEGNKGYCSVYEYRPLVCRLFGFSAITDKYSQPQLVTCEPIKKESASTFRCVVEDMKNGLRAPIMQDYYYRLMGIDLGLTQKRYPLNTAIRMAIEDVLFYFLYRS